MRQIQKIEKHYYENPDSTVRTEYHVYIDGFTYDCKDRLTKTEQAFWKENKNRTEEFFHLGRTLHF